MELRSGNSTSPAGITTGCAHAASSATIGVTGTGVGGRAIHASMLARLGSIAGIRDSGISDSRISDFVISDCGVSDFGISIAAALSTKGAAATGFLCRTWSATSVSQWMRRC